MAQKLSLSVSQNKCIDNLYFFRILDSRVENYLPNGVDYKTRQRTMISYHQQKDCLLKFGCVALFFLLFVAGCNNKTEEDRVLSPALGEVHPVGWMSRISGNFHGTAALLKTGQNCVDCHGTDYNGGTSGVSCISCHSKRDNPCINCHGGLESMTGSPPYGLDDEISDTTLAVGAHTLHVMGRGSGANVDCQACHIKPSFVLDSAHLDVSFITRKGLIDSVAEVTWGGIAGVGGANWNRNDRKCSGTYCHGNFEGGNKDNVPVWTSGNRAECGSCHDIGADAGKLGWKHEFHVTAMGLECNACHSNVVDNSLKIVNRRLHVNGVVDTLSTNQTECKLCHEPGTDLCVRCHGGIDNQTGAPPRGLRGEIARTEKAVGAHSAHVQSGIFADAFDCSECHIKPSTVADPGHYDKDSVAELVWGTLAGSSSQWNSSSASCSGTYCHGNFSGGNATNVPIWTALGQADCGSCHDDGSNPRLLSGEHREHIGEDGIDCNDCHYATTDSQRNIIGREIHVDGVVQVVLAAGGSYSNGTCSPSCHGTENWFDGD